MLLDWARRVIGSGNGAALNEQLQLIGGKYDERCVSNVETTHADERGCLTTSAAVCHRTQLHDGACRFKRRRRPADAEDGAYYQSEHEVCNQAGHCNDN